MHVRICALLALAAWALAACHRNEATVDRSTLDRGVVRNSPSAPPPQAPAALPAGTQILATPTAAELERYLGSDAAAGRSFELPAIRFVKGPQVRQDPDGAVTTLAAILRAHPDARVRLEVAMANPGEPAASDAAADRAARVAQLFVDAGVPADRVTSAGVKVPSSGPPQTRLVVVTK